MALVIVFQDDAGAWLRQADGEVPVVDGRGGAVVQIGDGQCASDISPERDVGGGEWRLRAAEGDDDAIAAVGIVVLPDCP